MSQMYLYQLPKLRDIYDEFIVSDNLTETENYDIIESFCNIIDYYITNNPLLFSEPKFHDNLSEYVNIFINYIDDNENVVYAKKGKIISNNNQYQFKLNDGFKISLNETGEIEKLEFKNYVLKIDHKNFNTNVAPHNPNN